MLKYLVFCLQKVPEKWRIDITVSFGDIKVPVEIYTFDERSFEIFVDNGREGSIEWMRRGWQFHTHYNTDLTTADFIIIADIIEGCCPFEFKVEWLETLSPGKGWSRPPRLDIHWAVIWYPKWPKVRHW